MLRRGGGNERWLISYADFITLLFATFVLMYVAAKKNEGRRFVLQQQLAQHESVNLLQDLTNSLRLEESSHTVRLSREPRGLLITLDDRTCFDEGKAEIRPEATAAFEKIGRVLARYPNYVLLQGHTDSTPIHNGEFRSNWELSTARSLAVMQLLQTRAGLPAGRVLVAGAADNLPVNMNDTQQGRAQNRRVDIIVLDAAAKNEAPTVLARGSAPPLR